MRGITILAMAALFSAMPCAAQGGARTAVADDGAAAGLAQWLASRPDPVAVDAESQTGLASYFSREMAGNRTASGERCDPDDFTAAHRTLPFGGRVRVTSLASGLSTIVRVNDRGPFRGGRIIDLSHAAARAIGLDRIGTGQVRLTPLSDR